MDFRERSGILVNMLRHAEHCEIASTNLGVRGSNPFGRAIHYRTELIIVAFTRQDESDD